VGASERNEEERAAWRAEVSPLPASQLVFVDECGSNIALTPLYARAPKGERAKGSVPRNRGKNTTLIASLSLEGMGAAMIPGSDRPMLLPLKSTSNSSCSPVCTRDKSW